MAEGSLKQKLKHDAEKGALLGAGVVGRVGGAVVGTARAVGAGVKGVVDAAGRQVNNARAKAAHVIAPHHS